MSVSVSDCVCVGYVSGMCRGCVTCVSVVCQPCVAVWEEGEEEDADRNALCQVCVSTGARDGKQRCATSVFHRQFHTDGQILLSCSNVPRHGMQ